MTNVRITRKAIENALKIMVATAPTFDTFVKYFYDYTAELDKADTNYMVIWDDDSDIFEIFKLRSNKSTFLDFSAELENLD